MTPLAVRRLGLVSYAEALDVQRTLVEDRKAGRVPDTLLLLEHPPVLTIGVKKDGRAHILALPERLASLGIEVFETGRGGDVTYHGPGQLVGYPIIDLSPDRRDVHRYVRDIEEVMIRVCADWSVAATRVPGLSGAWVGDAKIGAVGVRISRWVTSHGFALNVTTDLAWFDLIVPCGIADRRVTTLAACTNQLPDMAMVEARVAARFCEVFGREVTESLPPGGRSTPAPEAPIGSA